MRLAPTLLALSVALVAPIAAFPTSMTQVDAPVLAEQDISASYPLVKRAPGPDRPEKSSRYNVRFKPVGTSQQAQPPPPIAQPSSRPYNPRFADDRQAAGGQTVAGGAGLNQGQSYHNVHSPGVFPAQGGGVQQSQPNAAPGGSGYYRQQPAPPPAGTPNNYYPMQQAPRPAQPGQYYRPSASYPQANQPGRQDVDYYGGAGSSSAPSRQAPAPPPPAPAAPIRFATPQTPGSSAPPPPVPAAPVRFRTPQTPDNPKPPRKSHKTQPGS
ncbi:hypothetical protein K474DRAFT_61934 [Panus rudis PR-1116 ss-1]|nr:hypothetical protein K474DRAFT_61934 [Panus rudis PR-1116 ss-1]